MKIQFPWRKKILDNPPADEASPRVEPANHHVQESKSRHASGLSRNGEHALRDHHESLTKRARDQHDALTDAIEVLKRALAEIPHTGDDHWTDRVAAELENVRELMHAHADGVEEPEGLFDEIKTVQPRLAARTEYLQREHETFAARASGLAKELSEKTNDVDTVREETGKLLSRLRTHRANEAELVYEAFWTELGVGD